MSGNLPNCIIIGVAKCGTSALHDYLDLHPEISMSNPKELSFFSEARGWQYGLEWYKSHWPTPNKIMGESSPSYTYDPDWREVPKRIRETLPEVKLIYMVRDPIARILSHYQNMYRKRLEVRSLREALCMPTVSESVYVRDTRYYTHLSHYLQFFERSQMHVVILEELAADPQATMQGVFAFLGVDDGFYHEAYAQPMNESAAKRRESDLGLALKALRRSAVLARVPIPQFAADLYKVLLKRPVRRPVLDEALRQELIYALEDEMRRFRMLVGKDLDYWSV